MGKTLIFSQLEPLPEAKMATVVFSFFMFLSLKYELGWQSYEIISNFSNETTNNCEESCNFAPNIIKRTT